MTTPAALLEVSGLTCGYKRGRPVLRDIDLDVRAGQTVVLAGPSGSGKTTLLKTVLALVPALAGSVRILGHQERPPPGTVGYIPQSLGLVRHVTVLRNVLHGTLHDGHGVRNLFGAFSKDQVDRALEAIERVGLGHKAHERPVHLSGGERRRVSVARAVAQRPRLLLADEILSELDHRTKDVVIEAIRGLQRETGMGIVMVEHDLDTSCDVADLLLCLSAGTVAATLAPGPDRHRIAHELVGSGG